MNVAVLVKQIPDPDQPAALDPDDFRLVRGSGLVIDDADRYGVEIALSLRDESGGGEVVAVSMAPDGESGGLRAALAMGVDKALLVSDPALAGSDALSSAKVLAAALARIAPTAIPGRCRFRSRSYLGGRRSATQPRSPAPTPSSLRRGRPMPEQRTSSAHSPCS
jgi:hypothetical protein